MSAAAVIVADFDGWIDWAGGECPITSKDVEYQVRYRGGYDSEVRTLGAFGHRKGIWLHEPGDPGRDIVAYRVFGPLA